MAELTWTGVLERTGAGASAEAFVAAAGLEIRIVDASQIILACHLAPEAATPSQALQGAVEAATGHPLPLVPNTRSSGEDSYVVWMDPARWLVVGAGAQRWPRLAAIQAAVADAAPDALVSDASDALVMIEIAGARAPALMAMACALDIEAVAFAPPRTARAGFAGVTGLIYRHGSGFRAHVDASLLAHVREWLGQAARLLPGGAS